MTDEEAIITSAWLDGRKRITCPSCNGGDQHDPDTMSLWIGDDSHLRGKCFRATCPRPFVFCGPVTGWVKPDFIPCPLKAPYRRVEATDAWGKEWSARCEEDPFFFGIKNPPHNRGLRVLSALPDVAVWRLRALDGTLTGHITRTLDKKISTYKDLDRPLYYWNGLQNNKALFVFEDAMSAALCEYPAIALLGTSISDGIVKDIREWAVPDGVLVCLDPGAEDAALKVYERLVANGVPAVFVPMAKDFKDMTVAERRELEETYA